MGSEITFAPTPGRTNLPSIYCRVGHISLPPRAKNGLGQERRGERREDYYGAPSPHHCCSLDPYLHRASERATHSKPTSGRGETPICGATDARGIRPDFLDPPLHLPSRNRLVFMHEIGRVRQGQRRNHRHYNHQERRGEGGNQVTEYVVGCREENRKESVYTDSATVVSLIQVISYS